AFACRGLRVFCRHITALAGKRPNSSPKKLLPPNLTPVDARPSRRCDFFDENFARIEGLTRSGGFRENKTAPVSDVTKQRNAPWATDAGHGPDPGARQSIRWLEGCSGRRCRLPRRGK